VSRDRRRPLLVLLLVVGLLLAHLGSSPAPAGADPAPTGSITGTVRAAGGAPVAGATVWGFGPGDLWLGRARTTTDAAGRYELTGLQELPHRVAAVPPVGQNLGAVWHDAVTPGPDAPVEGVDLELPGRATISGRVVDPDGNPLAGVGVRAWATTDTWVASAGTTTGADGRYAIEDVKPGGHRVQFTRPDLTTRWSGPAMTRARSTLVTVTGTTGVSGIDATVTPAYAYTGVSDLIVENSDRCDPTADGCLLPFPSNHLTVADPTTPTGRRVEFAQASLPATNGGIQADPGPWNDLDGFSPSAALLLQIPDVDLAASGAAPVTDLAPSLDADSPVVLLDATTGRRLAHWVELDSYAEAGSAPTLFIRPAEAFREGHRIVVGIRDLVDTSGAPIAPTAGFLAYRDLVRTSDPNIEDRRPAMEQSFADLTNAGVERGDLQYAWDFTIASSEALSGRLLHMRDDAFASLEGSAPTFTVSYDQASTREGVAREIRGTYEVPMYLTGTGQAGSSLVIGADGLPVQTGTYTSNFRCIIPPSATTATPAGVGIYAHGLLGTANQINAPWRVASQGNRVFCGTDLIGMAEDDVPNAINILLGTTPFNTLPDRLLQGHLNTLFLGRLLVAPDGFASNPSFQVGGTPIINDDLVYYGISQGGIMGAATSAVAQDWTKATLDVAGINYGLLLDRSVDFDDFRMVMGAAYPKASDRALLLQIIQMLWDRGEAAGYAQHLVSDTYADTPPKQILLHAAFGDHQVSNLSTAYEARTLGIPAFKPALADGRSPEVDVFWGIPAVESFPHVGSAAVMWDSGAVVQPTTNLPARTGRDPHGDPRANPAAVNQIVRFFATGEIIDTCNGGPCTGPG
jgi:hypothetical protein